MPEEQKPGTPNPESNEKTLENGTEKAEMKDQGGIFGKKVPKDKLVEALAQLEKAEAESDHWKNEYYRVYADTQNLRKSLEDDRREAIKYRSEGFIENLLPALDGFHMALDTPPKNEETKNYLIGFQYIYNQIVKTLEDEGVKELSPKPGDHFDSTFMHAVDSVEQDGPEGVVIRVYAKGYKLHDRLIRPVMVSVSKKPQPKPEEKKTEQQTSQSPADKPVDNAHKA